jgi:thioredoxin 1
MIHTLNVETFDQVVKGTTLPILVDYWAEWCAPCKMMLPILTEISDEYTDNLLVVKVNVDEEPELAEGLKSIPTLRLFKDGKVVFEHTGAIPKRALLEKLKDFVNA